MSVHLGVSTRKLLAAAGAAIILAGCGGGAGGVSSGSSDPGTLLEVGALSTRVAGAAQPPVTLAAAGGANVTGIAGALVSNITLNPQGPPTLSDTRIAFATDRYGNFEICSMLPDGTSLARLTTTAGDQSNPSWGAGGTKIAYVSDQDGNYEIYVMNSNGSGQTRLTNSPGNDLYPAFSPDGTKIAFASARTGTSEIYVMNANGTGVTRVTWTSEWCFSPRWSPDGYTIAYTKVSGPDYDIYTINNNGSNTVLLTPGAEQGDSPDFSPDGQKIAYINVATHKVALMNVDGSGKADYAGGGFYDSSPCWSPDSTKLVFGSSRTSNGEIYVGDQYGSIKDVTLAPSNNDQSPAWSQYQPRGARLLLGTGGPLGTAAAGFLFSQTGYNVNSVVTFDTATTASRVDSRVVAQDNAGGAATNLIFSVTTSEGLGGLRYADLGPTGLAGTPKVLTIPAGTTGALVSFHSMTGLVSSVIFYAANRSAPQKAVEGDTVKYSGEFLGGWSRSQKAMPSGPFSEAAFNRTTGDLVQVH